MRSAIFTGVTHVSLDGFDEPLALVTARNFLWVSFRKFARFLSVATNILSWTLGLFQKFFWRTMDLK
jgi:hypothetical protein